MASLKMLCSVVVLSAFLAAVQGKPEPSVYYQTVPSGYASAYSVSYPYSYYKGWPSSYYYTDPSVYRPYKYTTSPTYPKKYSGDVVYITDKYGRTTQTASARLTGVTRYSGNCINCGHGGYVTYNNRLTAGPQLPHIEVPACTASTCGQNAHCSYAEGRPVCSCLRNYMGDPLSFCKRAECLDNSECRGHLTCRDGHCINPCDGVCGSGANCEVRQHLPICTCPEGYTGDPFSYCRPLSAEELCSQSPCGVNTDCIVVNNLPTCKCKAGYHGSPLTGCRHECENDAECGPTLTCIQFKCQNPCSLCGQNAECEPTGHHLAACRCPKGYFGDPYTACRPECYGDVDCPAGRPACFYGICKNPCDGACGVGANCELRGLTPICSCPKDMTGDPFVMCRPFEARALCEPSPCGANTNCVPGHDSSGQERPVCNCKWGFLGDPLSGCIKGDCTADEHCPDSQACVDYTCQNPCKTQCGVNAMCSPRRHIAVCTCPPGYLGDAVSQCYLEHRATVGCDTCG